MKHTKAHRNDRMASLQQITGEIVSIWHVNAAQRGEREYDVSPVVWVLCPGTGKHARQGEHDFDTAWLCGHCRGGFEDDEVTSDGKDHMLLPQHAVRLSHERDLDEKMTTVIQTLGLDHHATLPVFIALRDNVHRESPEVALAEAVQALATLLQRQAATKAVVKVVKDMEHMKVGDEFCGWPEGTSSYREYDGYDEETETDTDAPFFTEGFLYNLLGKEAARTVLSRFKRLQKAVGRG